MSVRPAEPADVPEILDLVRGLADYHHAADSVVSNEGDFSAALFPADGTPKVFCHVAEVDGRVVGMALWFLTWSTWTGRHGIWLEDLYLSPDQRGSGLGADLLAALAAICVERGYPRLEWWVLDWNEPGIGFYLRLGAEPHDDTTTYRLSGPALTALGSR